MIEGDRATVLGYAENGDIKFCREARRFAVGRSRRWGSLHDGWIDIWPLSGGARVGICPQTDFLDHFTVEWKNRVIYDSRYPEKLGVAT